MRSFRVKFYRLDDLPVPTSRYTHYGFHLFYIHYNSQWEEMALWPRCLRRPQKQHTKLTSKFGNNVHQPSWAMMNTWHAFDAWPCHCQSKQLFDARLFVWLCVCLVTFSFESLAINILTYLYLYPQHWYKAHNFFSLALLTDTIPDLTRKTGCAWRAISTFIVSQQYKRWVFHKYICKRTSIMNSSTGGQYR